MGTAWDAAERLAWVALSAFSAFCAWLTSRDPFEGVSFSLFFAGFSGAVIALAFLPPMQRWKMVFAVCVGTLTAAYGILPVTELLNLKKVYPGIAFAIGLVAYGLLTWLFKDGCRVLARRLGGGK